MIIEIHTEPVLESVRSAVNAERKYCPESNNQDEP
jgi:hypothetical protein